VGHKGEKRTNDVLEPPLVTRIKLGKKKKKKKLKRVKNPENPSHKITPHPKIKEKNGL